MERAERSAADFESGFHCAPAVLAAFADQYGLDRDMALKLASGLGGGIARTGQVCGAVTGALLVIGLHWGTADAADMEGKENTYAMCREFMRRFTALHGTTECRRLLGCDISLPEGLQFARQNNLFSLFCQNYVRDATMIVEEMIRKP